MYRTTIKRGENDKIKVKIIEYNNYVYNDAYNCIDVYKYKVMVRAKKLFARWKCAYASKVFDNSKHTQYKAYSYKIFNRLING